MTPFYYEKYVAARQLRQKTQKEVAAALNLKQSRLSKAENGFINLSKDELLELSRFYDLPIDFFDNNHDLAPIGTIYYRRKQTIPNKVIDAFKAKIRIFKDIVDCIMEAVEVPEYSLGNYDVNKNTPQEIAQQVRFVMNIKHGAVPDLAALLENFGVLIIKFDFGTEQIDGVTCISQGDKKIMFINELMPNDRIRFSMAHELGHLLMHVANLPCNPEEAEKQADEFASEFLMPKAEIMPMLYNLNIQNLSILKKRWRVSMHALVRRAKDLGTISQSQYRNIQIFFSKKKYSKNEPIPLTPDRPMMWNEIIRLYHTELGYTDQDLMQLMHLNQNDYNNWFVDRPQVIKIRLTPKTIYDFKE